MTSERKVLRVSGPEAEQPDGFWLLRDIDAAARSKR